MKIVIINGSHGKNGYRLQGMIHWIVFRVGIQPFVKRKGVEYEGVIKHWKNHLRKLSPN